jgi:hypothetical protein
MSLEADGSIIKVFPITMYSVIGLIVYIMSAI